MPNNPKPITSEKEAVEQFREKFNKIVVKESGGDYYAMILPKDIHEHDEYSLVDIGSFISRVWQAASRETARDIQKISKTGEESFPPCRVKLKWLNNWIKAKYLSGEDKTL